MPSYVIHLSCAKRILELAGEPLTKQDANLFYLGNMIADMCKDKRTTHFWDDEAESFAFSGQVWCIYAGAVCERILCAFVSG